MTTYTVTYTGCTAGNPLQAWHGTTSTDTVEDTEHVPNDVWTDLSYDFPDDLDGAKAYVRGLPAQTTTHVQILADGTLIYDKDAAADELDDAAAGWTMPHTVDRGGPVDQSVIPPPPPLPEPPA